MTAIDRRGVALILGTIRTFHQGQDIGEAVITSWERALSRANVTRLEDAMEAVDRHYSTPGADRWITPGDLISNYQELRNERRMSVSFADITEDIDGSDGPAYLATLKVRLAAIADGATVEQANRIPPPPEARHALVTGWKPPALTAGDR